MSAQNISMKFKDVIVKQITCEAVKMGKDTVPLMKYGPDKKTLYITGPWIKLKQFGIPPGETLSNGAKNDYYAGEDSRLSIRFPIDSKCCVQDDKNPDVTNTEEMEDFIKFLQTLDEHIKTDPTFMTVSGIDPDDKEKYTSIYRKPTKPKKSGKDTKEKYYSMKTKLDTDGLDSDKKIKTEFYILDKDTNQYSLVNRNKYIQLEDIEETLKYNSEVLPVFQFVKVWTQSTGGWGVTLKLKKVRIKNSVYSEQGDAIFLDDDNYEQTEKVMPPKPPSAPTPTPVNKQKLVEVESDDDSDEESDEEVAQVVASKVKVEKSDSESDDEPVKPKQVTKIVASDSESDEDVKPKKPIKKVTKAKKASA
jgi:hypothetical protein